MEFFLQVTHNNNISTPWFVPGVILMLAFLFILILKRNARLAKGKLSGLSETLGGKIREGMGKSILKTAWEGREFELTLSTGSKKGDFSLEISYPYPFEVDFSIITHDPDFDFEKETGLSAMKTDDEEFDRAFLVLGKTKADCRFFLTPERRRHIKEMDFSTLEFSSRGLTYTKTPLVEQDLWPERVTALLTDLKALSD